MGVLVGKFSGFVLGTTAAVIISYYILAPYYSPLINWLSPYFGSSVALILGLVFLTFGDPFVYPVVIAVWVAIGAIVGLSVRRVKGSIVSIIFVHAACVVILLIGIAGTVLSLLPAGRGFLPTTAGGGLATSPSFPPVPIPPYGTNILTIISEPVIQQLFHALYELLPKLSSLSGQSSFANSGLNLFSRYALPAILVSIFTFVVSLITAALVAHFARKFIAGLERPPALKSPGLTSQMLVVFALLVVMSLVLSSASSGSAAFPGVNGSGSSARNTPSLQSAVLPAVDVLSKLACVNKVVDHLSSYPALAHSPAAANPSTSSLSRGAYDEVSVNLISSDGNLYSGYAFVSNYSLPQALVPGNSQVGVSLLVLTHNLVDLPLQSLIGKSNNSSGNATISPFSSNPSSFVSSFLPLVPPGLLLIMVNPGPQPLLKVAGEQVSYYSKLTGEKFSLLADLQNTSLSGLSSGGSTTSTTNTSSSPSSGGGDLFIYATNSPAERAAASVASSYLPSLHTDGLIGSFSNLLSTGALFDPTAYGTDSGLLAIGYAETAGMLPQGGSASPSNLLNIPRGNISFCMGLFYKSDFSFSAGLHTVQLSTFTGTPPVSFSPSASFSMLSVISPTGFNDLSISSFPNGFNGTVFTTDPHAANLTTVSRSGWTFVNESGRGTLSPATIVNFSSPLPPEVVMSGTVASAGDTVTVNAVLKNLGNTTVNGLSVHFPGIDVLQPGFTAVTAGAAYQNSSTLSPGQSFDARFVFGVPHPGVYVLPRLLYSYENGGHEFSLQSAFMQASVGQTFLFVMFPGYFTKATYGLVSHLAPGTPYVAMLGLSYALLTLFMSLALYSEYSAFRKWKMRRASASKTSSTGPTVQEPTGARELSSSPPPSLSPPVPPAEEDVPEETPPSP